MAQATNPFNDAPIDNSEIINTIIDRKELNISKTAVAIRIPRHDKPEQSVIHFIEWDFLYNNSTDNEYQKIKPFIQGMWHNGYPIVEGSEVISLPMLQQKLASASLPSTPKEKMDNLLLYIVKQQPEDGASISMYLNRIYNRLYFKSFSEATFYLQALTADGLVVSRVDHPGVAYITLTYKGLSYAAELEREGPASKICFVAMSFDQDPSIYTLYLEGIKPAIEATGFESFRVDEYHPDSDQTINDAIIAGIKRSRFCIADFTQHKKGVYFEAGYALGRGMKVIYTCRNDEFKDSHFDTNHYPHILYDTPEELRAKLINKIEAWIKE